MDMETKVWLTVSLDCNTCKGIGTYLVWCSLSQHLGRRRNGQHSDSNGFNMNIFKLSNLKLARPTKLSEWFGLIYNRGWFLSKLSALGFRSLLGRRSPRVLPSWNLGFSRRSRPKKRRTWSQVLHWGRLTCFGRWDVYHHFNSFYIWYWHDFAWYSPWV